MTDMNEVSPSAIDEREVMQTSPGKDIAGTAESKTRGAVCAVGKPVAPTRALRLSLMLAAIVAAPLSSASADANACQWKFSPGGAENFRLLATGPSLPNLRFGDFDGDGKTDVFAAAPRGDGTSQWMFSPGGVENFRNLAIGNELQALRFGDFDGDGKTDVFAATPRADGRSQWMFSPGGAENFQDLAIGNELNALRFGDFDGDGRTDVFSWVAGNVPVQYVVSSGGVQDFTNLHKGRVPVGLGDFDGDGRTDVFVIGAFLGNGSQWMFSPGGAEEFRDLAVGPGTTPAFGDFDGDGRTDVFASASLEDGTHQWKFSPGGAGDFQDLAIGPSLLEGGLAFGDFDGDRRTDVFVADCS